MLRYRKTVWQIRWAYTRQIAIYKTFTLKKHYMQQDHNEKKKKKKKKKEDQWEVLLSYLNFLYRYFNCLQNLSIYTSYFKGTGCPRNVIGEEPKKFILITKL